MTLSNRIRLDVFFATMIFCCFTALFGYFAAFAKDEGTLGNGIVANLIADNTIYLFPLVFLVDIFRNQTFFAAILLTGINILGYSFLAAIVFTNRVSNIKTYKPFLITYYAISAILLMILTYTVFLIFNSK